MNRDLIPQASFERAPTDAELRRFWMDVYVTQARRTDAMLSDDDFVMSCAQGADEAVAELLARIRASKPGGTGP